MAEPIAGISRLDICGIDVITFDIAILLNEDRGAVLEVNAAPDFRMHIAPTDGLPRNVTEPVKKNAYKIKAAGNFPAAFISN